MTAARPNPVPRRWLHLTAIALVAVTIATCGIGLLTAVERVREAARRSYDNVKQLHLAMYNYESTYGSLPPVANTDRDGKPLLSWRVLILPYIEQEPLFKEFHLNEPWDSPHNIRLLDRMPGIYGPFGWQIPDGYPPNHTCFRVFIGTGTLFEAGKTMRWSDCDDPAGTFLIVESAEPIPWTKPDGLALEPDGPFRPLGVRRGFFRAVMADGSYRTFDKPMNEAQLRPMIYRTKPK